MAQTTKFATLQYEVLHQLELTIAEYFYLDMVYHLSRGGSCYKSLDSIAHDMRITKNGVIKMRDRLTERGLLIHRGNNRVSTSVKYNSVYLTDSKPYNSVTNRTTEYTQNVQLSGTKNNNRNTENKLFELNSNGTPTLAARERALGVARPRI